MTGRGGEESSGLLCSAESVGPGRDFGTGIQHSPDPDSALQVCCYAAGAAKDHGGCAVVQKGTVQAAGKVCIPAALVADQQFPVNHK